MSDSYTYDPNSWNPILAGVVAGATSAIVAALFALVLDSPNDSDGNSLIIVLVALAIGAASGFLWRRLRATNNALRTFGWTVAGGFLITLMAIAVADQTFVDSLVPYAVPLAALIFITVGFITPLLDGITAPSWVAIIPIVLALAIGIGLFGTNSSSQAMDSADHPVDVGADHDL